jgi:NADPH:quinone reductase-like Zn-dependent oxidoreductase
LPHQLPIILGWDLAGIVEETGFSVSRFKKGDEVYSYARRPIIEKGTYAEFISLPESYISYKPHKMTFEEAATIPLVGLTAYQALFYKADIGQGQVVLVLGASGGVGSMAIQLIKIAGAKAIALASSANADYLKSLGADLVLSYDKEDWVAKFNSLFPGKANIVFDCSGGENFLKGHHCVKKGGFLVSITGQADQNLVEANGFKFIYHFVEPNAVELDKLAFFIDSGKLMTFIHSVFPLNEAAKAHEQIETRHTRGKIVLTIV